jgi:hypothetical protein
MHLDWQQFCTSSRLLEALGWRLCGMPSANADTLMVAGGTSFWHSHRLDTAKHEQLLEVHAPFVYLFVCAAQASRLTSQTLRKRMPSTRTAMGMSMSSWTWHLTRRCAYVSLELCAVST